MSKTGLTHFHKNLKNTEKMGHCPVFKNPKIKKKYF